MSPFYSPFFLNAQVSLCFAGLLICESSVECIASDFWTVSVSVSGFAPRPEKNPPKEVVSQILFVTLPCLSLDFLFLFATRRYVEFFDMARPWAAFVAQDIKSIINYSAAE